MMADFAISVGQEIAEWHHGRFGDIDDRIIAAKLAEECGEVCGAIIKHHEGRTDAFDVAAELGDLLIVATVLAYRYGSTLDYLRSRRFDTIKGRP